MTDMLQWDPTKIEDFIEYVANGVGPLTAALAVDWTPKMLADFMGDESFRELVLWAEERKIETIEEVCFEKAKKGNTTLIQFYLLSKGAHRGWRPPTQRVAVNTQSEVRIEVVEAQREALLQIMRDQGIAALQPTQDVIEVGEADDSDTG